MIWLAGILVYIGITYCFYWVAFYNPESRHRDAVITKFDQTHVQERLNKEMDDLPYERVTITSKDGLHLSGRYYHVQDGACVHIQFHGYRGNILRDLSAGNQVVRSLGYNSLVVDQRAHGMSQGNTMTFGIRERWDCVCWAQYARDRFGPDVPIFLSGISLGGATVLMASELPLPDSVVGIIADCPFSSPVGIIKKICRDIHIPGWIAVPMAVSSALLWGGFWLPAASAETAVRKAKVPILLIHGTEDKYILPEMSRRIQANCASQCYLEQFPGAVHAGSCITDGPRYGKILESFVRACLNQKKKE